MRIKLYGTAIILSVCLANTLVHAQNVAGEAKIKVLGVSIETAQKALKTKELSLQELEKQAKRGWYDGLKGDLFEMASNRGMKPQDTNKFFKVIDCENPGWDQFKDSPINPDGKTWDRGLVQFNSWWYRHLDPRCVYDAYCAFNEAITVIQKNGDMCQWSCTRTEKLKAFFPECQDKK